LDAIGATGKYPSPLVVDLEVVLPDARRLVLLDEARRGLDALRTVCPELLVDDFWGFNAREEPPRLTCKDIMVRSPSGVSSEVDSFLWHDRELGVGAFDIWVSTVHEGIQSSDAPVDLFLTFFAQYGATEDDIRAEHPHALVVFKWPDSDTLASDSAEQLILPARGVLPIGDMAMSYSLDELRSTLTSYFRLILN
jgi:hypothetical protein